MSFATNQTAPPGVNELRLPLHSLPIRVERPGWRCSQRFVLSLSGFLCAPVGGGGGGGCGLGGRCTHLGDGGGGCCGGWLTSCGCTSMMLPSDLVRTCVLTWSGGTSGRGGFSGRSPDSDIEVGRCPTLGLLCKFEPEFVPLLSLPVPFPRTCIILTCCLSTEYMCALSKVNGWNKKETFRI